MGKCGMRGERPGNTDATRSYVKPKNIFCICVSSEYCLPGCLERNAVMCHIMAFLPTMGHVDNGAAARL